MFQFTLLTTTILGLTVAISHAQNLPKAPLRQVKFQAIIDKISQEKQADGSYERKTERVCTVNDKKFLYEINPGDSVEVPRQPAVCKTNLKVGPGVINIDGAIVIERGVPDNFNIGKTVTLKTALSYFDVQSDDGKYSRLGRDNFSQSEDPNQKVFIFGMTDPIDANLAETFQVTVRFED